MPRLIDLGPSKGDLQRVAQNRRHETPDGLVVILQGQREFDPIRPSCLVCGPKTVGTLVPGTTIHPGRSDLHLKWFYQCPNDPDHYVGTHDGIVIDGKPTALGFMAGKQARYWRMQAHEHFDPIWKRRMVKHNERRGKARATCYTWLAKKLGVPKAHMSQLSVAQLRQVVDICAPIKERISKGEL